MLRATQFGSKTLCWALCLAWLNVVKCAILWDTRFSYVMWTYSINIDLIFRPTPIHVALPHTTIRLLVNYRVLDFRQLYDLFSTACIYIWLSCCFPSVHMAEHDTSPYNNVLVEFLNRYLLALYDSLRHVGLSELQTCQQCAKQLDICP